MIILIDGDGLIIDKAENAQETPVHYIFNGSAYMKNLFSVFLVDAVPENKTHYVDGEFKRKGKSEISKRKKAILEELESSDKKIMQFLDDLTDFCKTLGFVPSNKFKNELQARKALKQELDEGV